MIDKDIEIVKDLGLEYYVVNKKRTKITFKESQAIENVLSEFQSLREFSAETVRRNAEQKEELETYKKIAEMFGKSLISISGEKTSLEELIDWARKEVEKDVKD